MNNILKQAIASGEQSLSLTITASDLMEVISSIWGDMQMREQMREQEREKATMTRAETALALNVSNATLWRWEKCGYLKPVKVGARVLYRRSDVNALQGMTDGKA